MKKHLLLLALAVAATACSIEPELNEDSPNQGVNLAAPVYDESNLGVYKGTFTTNNAKYRGTVEIRISEGNNGTYSNYPQATVTLQTGKVITLKAQQDVVYNESLESLVFKGEKMSFEFSVGADGSEPTVQDVAYLGMASDILVVKETSLGPVSNITGTWVCVQCGGSPFINAGQPQTFNITVSSGSISGSVAVATQATLNLTTYSGIGYQENCATVGAYDVCEIRSGGSSGLAGGFLANGNPVFWEGGNIYNPTSGTPGAFAFGVWEWESISYGTIAGIWRSDVNLDFTPAVLYQEDFNSFTGAGFTPNPTAGQLDSDIIRVSEINSVGLAFGGTRTAPGDPFHARGQGGVGAQADAPGIWSYNNKFQVLGGGGVLGVRPGLGCFDTQAGFVEIRIPNTTGNPLGLVGISYDALVKNVGDGNGKTELLYAVSNGGSAPALGDYNLVQGSIFTSSEAADNNSLISPKTKILPVSIPVGEALYLRFYVDMITGSNTDWDLYAFDNILVEAL